LLGIGLAAYFATPHAVAPQLAEAGAAPSRPHALRHARHARRAHPVPVPAAEVIVGHPRDGIVELPSVTRKVPR
jgi:hypothetical protein